VPTLGVRVRKLAPVTDQVRVVDCPPISVVGEAEKLAMKGGVPAVAAAGARRHAPARIKEMILMMPFRRLIGREGESLRPKV
jgi:hypothetical protein